MKSGKTHSEIEQKDKAYKLKWFTIFYNHEVDRIRIVEYRNAFVAYLR